MPPLEVAELRDALAVAGFADAEELARVVHALADGHGGHASALVARMQALSAHGGTDAVSALAAMMEPGAEAARAIGWCYELRLHRARGYGALKGILGILAEEEPLTLTEIAQRLQRTPGSTKDYLSWLEDVDLVQVHHKRYRFADAILRLWVRLHCRPVASDRRRDRNRGPPVRDRAAAAGRAGDGARRLPATPASDDERKTWGIIEID